MSAANLVEIQNQEALVSEWRKFGRVELLSEVDAKDRKLPIYGLTLGPDDRTLPTFGIFAGVHGLERVGTHVALNFLTPLLAQLAWDKTLQDSFSRMRLVAIPIINPGGMYLNTRSNPNGVDIMRNAPIDAVGDLKPLVSGHRLSPRLPWYRGALGDEMEHETKTMIDFIKRETLQSDFAMTIDIHSGFGMRDRLWYPFSFTRDEFPYLSQINTIAEKLKESFPFHVYIIEPQHKSYMLHGDPWDFIFNAHAADGAKTGRVFIPWCLEMGSWTWLKKNPMQLFTRHGIFNPILPHRYSRIMRRHRPLLEFFKQITQHHQIWRGLTNGRTA
jgi:Zinc carboxypeptidase